MNIAKWTVIAITVAGLAYGGVIISQRVEVVKAERAEQAKPVDVPPPAAETAPLTTHDYVEKLTVTGELKPKATVAVMAKLPGEVKVLHVKVGDTIESGKPVAELDPGDLPLRKRQVQAQRRAASAGLAQAKVAVENAEVEVERARKLAKANALPKADLDRAEAGLKTARAAVRAAAAQVRVASTGIALVDHSLGYVEVLAPRTGVVTKVDTTVGAMASPAISLATIQDQSELLLHMKVPAEGLLALERNPKVEFVITALPGRRFHGTVKVVTPTLDPQSRRAHVEVTVDPAQKGLLPHMFAEVDLVTSKRAALLSAPLGAVLTTVKGSQVFVARGGKAVALNVDLKQADAEFVPVPDARAGDRVIVSGQGDLTDGGAIRVVDKATPDSRKKAADAQKGATR